MLTRMLCERVLRPWCRLESTVEFGVLGPFEVLADGGAPIDVGGPKQRAVLALLAINHGRVVPLDRLIDELWGDDPPASAAATIQAYISNLRRALEPDRPPRAPATILVSRAPGYVLDIPGEALDASRFATLVEKARDIGEADPPSARLLLDEALALWRGPALADFTYETFAIAEIDRLESMHVGAIEERIDLDLRLGAHQSVVPEIEHLVQTHPFRERLWGQLMVALYRSGRQAEALRAYRRFETILGDELGLEPGPELRRLEEEILTQAPTLAPPARMPPPSIEEAPPPPVAEPGMIGRDAELAMFDAALAEAREGRGSLLLVEGEPGIGKSKLVETLLDRARRQDVVAGMARCFELGGTPPFWPWVQASRDLMAELGVATLTSAAGGFARELAPFFPELRPDKSRPPAPLNVTPHRVADGIIHTFRTLAHDRPLLIAVDDLYAADPDSLAVLTVMAHALADLGLVIVGTYREIDVDDQSPFGDILARLSQLQTTRRVTLTPLDVASVAGLIRDVTLADVDTATAAAVHGRTDGNAFFTVELARLLAAEANLSAEGASQAGLIPGSVRDVLRRRLARLPDETVHVLRFAAVVGRAFDLDVVAEIAGVSEDRALDLVDLAVASGIVTESDRPGRFRFSHVLMRDAVAGTMNALRAARTHQQIADTLERLHGSEHGQLSEIAFHAVRAAPVAGAEQALVRLQAAADEALSAGGLESAEAFHRTRLDLITGLPEGADRDRLEHAALLDCARVLVAREGYHSPDLEPVHRRLSDLAERSGPELAIPTLIGRWAFHTVRGELDAAGAVHDALSQLAAPIPDPMLGLIVNHSGGILDLHRGHIGEALRRFAISDDLLGVIDPGDSATVMYPGLDQAAVVSHTNFLSLAQWLSGDAQAAWNTTHRGVAAATRANHVYSIAFALTFQAYLAAMAHEADLAAEVGERAANLCDRNGFTFLMSMVDVAVGWSAATRGDATAWDRLSGVDRLLTEAKTGGFFTASWGLIADAGLRLGMIDEAQEVLDRAILFSDRAGEMLWRPELDRVRAEIHQSCGRTAEARLCLDHSTSVAQSLGLNALRDRTAATVRRLASPRP